MTNLAIRLVLISSMSGRMVFGADDWTGQTVFWKDIVGAKVNGQEANTRLGGYVAFPSTVLAVEGEWLVLEPLTFETTVGCKNANGEQSRSVNVKMARSIKLRAADALRSDEALRYFTDRITAKPSPHEYSWRAAVWRTLGKHERANDDERAANELEQLLAKPKNHIPSDVTRTNPDPWIGEPVFWRHGAKVFFQDQELPATLAPWSARVDGVDGDWLLVGQVRIRTSDALSPLEAWHQYDRLEPSVDEREAIAERYRGFGLLYHTRRRFDEAIDNYSNAIRAFPTYARAYHDRAAAQFEKGKIDLALDDASQAIRLEPSCALFYSGRGNLWIAKGQFDNALRDFSEAMRLEPNNSMIYRSRGIAQLQARGVDAAIADFDRAIALDNGDFEAYRERGAAQLSNNNLVAGLKDLDTAISLYSVALGNDRRNAELYVGRAQARHNRGERVRAIDDYSEAIRLNPNSAAAYLGRERVWRDEGTNEKAHSDHDRALQLDPHGYFKVQESRPLL